METKKQEGALQVCTNCKRSVASAYLALHEARCLLFLALCPECKAPIQQGRMNEHCENGHQQVWCAMCQQSMQKHLLELHETTECQERPAECKFCGSAVCLSKLEVHEHHCGSRRELCLDCGQLIVRRVLAQHRDTCRSKRAQRGTGKRISAPKSTIYCHECNQMIPGNKYVQHMDKCGTASESAKYFPTGEPRISLLSLESRAAKDQPSTAEKDVRPKMKNMTRVSPLPGNSMKQAPSGTGRAVCQPLKPECGLWSTSREEEAEAYDILKRCPQCDILLPEPILSQHQTDMLVCPRATDKPGEEKEKKPQDLLPENSDQAPAPQWPGHLEEAQLCPFYTPTGHV